MSLPTLNGITSSAVLPRRALEFLDRAFANRWVQGGLFLGSFLLFWLLGSGVAHS